MRQRRSSREGAQIYRVVNDDIEFVLDAARSPALLPGRATGHMRSSDEGREQGATGRDRGSGSVPVVIV